MGVTDIGLKSTGFVAGVVFGIGVMWAVRHAAGTWTSDIEKFTNFDIMWLSCEEQIL